MDLSLKNREWKEFFIEEIAEINSGQDIYKAERINGDTPYVSSTALNNGIGYFVGNNNKTLEKGCLSINRNGSVGFSFYHDYPALYSNDCRKLRLNHPSKHVGIFISQQITKQKNKYGYGYKMGTERIKRQKIILPTNSKGEPDYEFMESFIRQKEQEKINAYKKYILKKINELKNVKDIVSLSEKDWEEFEINKIFDIKSGKRLTKANMTKGKKPFIGSTDNNNGITGFVSNTNSSEDFNVLGVNYNGSVVENFFHPYRALFSDDVKRLSFKKVKGNRHLYLFAKTQILKQKRKYQYGYKFNGTRMNRQKIMLPVNEKHEPDYEYMENYMKILELNKLKNYLE